MLTWRSAPNVEDLVAGYKIEYGEDERRMRPHSSGFVSFSYEKTETDRTNVRLFQVKFVGTQRPYQVSLEDLPEGQNFVRLHVVDANQGVAYTSASLPVRIFPKCRAPTSPPRDVQVRGGSGDQISLMWNVSDSLIILIILISAQQT